MKTLKESGTLLQALTVAKIVNGSLKRLSKPKKNDLLADKVQEGCTLRDETL